MPALVIYDSAYGNTAQIAEAIRSGLPDGAIIRLISSLDPRHLPEADLLVIGSPTQGGRPTPAMLAWLDKLPAASFRGKQFAAFDTRIDADRQGIGLRFVMGLIGYAAPRIAASLTAKGAKEIAQPTGFIVTGKEGPLAGGEVARAKAWAAAIATSTGQRRAA
jgi:flavodoxin